MAITQAQVLTDVKMQFKRADKDTELQTALQFVVDDIMDHFQDFRELITTSSAFTLTQNVASVDISSITDMYGNRIKQVVLRDSNDDDFNRTLTEVDYHNKYLRLLPVPTDVDSEDTEYPELYARNNDVLYFYPVPEYTTLSVLVHYGKEHPTISSSQNVLFPDDWRSVLMDGVLYYIYKFLYTGRDRINQKASEQWAIYKSQRDKKIRTYQARPNQISTVKYHDV